VPTVRSRGKLPHWEEHYAIYFVTFRMADSLPQSVLQKFEFERSNIIATARAAGRDLSPFERTRLEELFSEQIEQKLDAGAGSCFLANPTIAKQVS
jgi:putative transposase